MGCWSSFLCIDVFQFECETERGTFCAHGRKEGSEAECDLQREKRGASFFDCSRLSGQPAGRRLSPGRILRAPCNKRFRVAASRFVATCQLASPPTAVHSPVSQSSYRSRFSSFPRAHLSRIARQLGADVRSRCTDRREIKASDGLVIAVVSKSCSVEPIRMPPEKFSTSRGTYSELLIVRAFLRQRCRVVVQQLLLEHRAI